MSPILTLIVSIRYSKRGHSMRRSVAVLALSGAMVVGLGTSAFAAGPGTFYGSTMTRPTSSIPKYGSFKGSGCEATTTAKRDRAQTILTDWYADSGLVCDQVAVRLFFYSGSSSYYSAWKWDADSAEIASTSYTSASYKMSVLSA